MDIDLRFGRYQDVLAGVECDVLMSDLPYSKKTHKGRRTGSEVRASKISYDHITRWDAYEYAKIWHEKTRWWVLIFSDHITWKSHELYWRHFGWYTFQPIPWIKPNTTPRLTGDGPASAAEYIFVARRKIRLPKKRSGSRPGYYIYGTETGGNINKITGKTYPGREPLNLMRALVHDYTLPDDTVVDTHVGTGTTLIACAEKSRKPIGSEATETGFQIAHDRVKNGYVLDMFVA